MIDRLNVAASDADWYYCAVVERPWGETDYVDGYAAGARPTLEEFQTHNKCNHEYVAGMMVVNSEDLESISSSRKVECQQCDHVYGTPEKPIKVIEWETAPTPHGAHHGEEREAVECSH